jgi:hypothetical protein
MNTSAQNASKGAASLGESGFRQSLLAVSASRWNRAADLDRVIEDAVNDRRIVGTVVLAPLGNCPPRQDSAGVSACRF